MGSCEKREQASLALNFQVFPGRRDFDAVDRLSRQAIGRAENLDGTYEIEFIDRGNRKDDDSPIGSCALPSQTALSVGHTGPLCSAASRFANRHRVLAEIVRPLAENANAPVLRCLPKSATCRGGAMRHRWIVVLGAVVPVLFAAKIARGPEAQTEKVSYARIAVMRALDGHSVDWEAGYVRHLDRKSTRLNSSHLGIS